MLKALAIIGGVPAFIILTALALKPKVKQVKRKEIRYYRDPEGRIIKVEEKGWTE